MYGYAWVANFFMKIKDIIDTKKIENRLSSRFFFISLYSQSSSTKKPESILNVFKYIKGNAYLSTINLQFSAFIREW